VAARETTTLAVAYCPHCFLPMEERVRLPWPTAARRCPHCRLMVGQGRARRSPAAKPGARGTAAGLFAHEAKRDDEGSGMPRDEVLEGIRRVARQLGHRPERLLMIDYQQRAVSDPEVPDLSTVFAAFGSWKRARREAAAG
jgi:Homing endonuclease associated repeat